MDEPPEWNCHSLIFIFFIITGLTTVQPPGVICLAKPTLRFKCKLQDNILKLNGIQTRCPLSFSRTENFLHKIGQISTFSSGVRKSRFMAQISHWDVFWLQQNEIKLLRNKCVQITLPAFHIKSNLSCKLSDNKSLHTHVRLIPRWSNLSTCPVSVLDGTWYQRHCRPQGD